MCIHIHDEVTATSCDRAAGHHFESFDVQSISNFQISRQLFSHDAATVSFRSMLTLTDITSRSLTVEFRKSHLNFPTFLIPSPLTSSRLSDFPDHTFPWHLPTWRDRKSLLERNSCLLKVHSWLLGVSLSSRTRAVGST